MVNALSGFVKPTAGSLTISGSEVCGREAHVIAQAGLARTFQNIRLFGAMSVLETVLVGAHRHFDANLWHLLFLRRALRVHEAQMVEQAKHFCALSVWMKALMSVPSPPLPTAISAG
ncbi:hypothetical protein P7I89_21775 [Pseudomonas aeruginosa]|nr:hypothetical protein P7I89_21775 [Pseudomonas aeruginosa]